MEIHDPNHHDLAVRRPTAHGRGSWTRRALLIWLLACGPACFLLYRYIEPTYEATSILRVEPAVEPITSPDLHNNRDISEVRPYLRTQMQLMKSDKVLAAALARTEINRLPMARSSKDPRADLRKNLGVSIVDDTYLIRVTLGSKDPAEAAAIVNGVVREYLDQHNGYQANANRALKKSLESEQEKLEKQIRYARETLAAMVEKGVADTRTRPKVHPAGKEKK